MKRLIQLRDRVGSIEFTEYVNTIKDLTVGKTVISSTKWRRTLIECLDGGPNRVLRLQPKQEELKKQGAFFTGSKLANQVASAAAKGKPANTIYYDPTCGAGDLLLAIARKLPLAKTFHQTIQNWGEQLAGCDISSDFVRLAKYRLTLLAAKRHHVQPPLNLNENDGQFPLLTVADTFRSLFQNVKCDVVVMNPPFTYGVAPVDCAWANGRVNTAATYIDRAVADMKQGSRLVALLPEVLRSGSRYVSWRQQINDAGRVISERSLGVFDEWADVDVYLLQFEKGVKLDTVNTSNRHKDVLNGGVGKRFNVHVGSVVPHRHSELGPKVPYVHARSVEAWSEYEDIPNMRRFAGRLFNPPFVVVRRTSRPGFGKRAAATLILGPKPVAVENHLVVFLPKDGSSRTCRELMRRLRSSRTDEWLNRRLRCRHLTTRILTQLPWWYKP